MAGRKTPHPPPLQKAAAGRAGSPLSARPLPFHPKGRKGTGSSRKHRRLAFPVSPLAVSLLIKTMNETATPPFPSPLAFISSNGNRIRHRILSETPEAFLMRVTRFRRHA